MLEAKGVIIATMALLILAIVLIDNHKIYITTTGGLSGKKQTELRYIILILLFWLFASCVMDSADLSIYRWAFESRISHGKEPLFDLLTFYFHDIGWTFEQFKLLWVSITALLLYVGIKKYSNDPTKVVALALFTVLTGFITQMRSAMVCAIFINAFQLIISGKRRDRIIYLLVILFAAQFHIVGYCFLVFLLINKSQKRIFRKLYYIIISIVTLVALFSSSFASSYINSVLSIFLSGGTGAKRTLSYFSGESSHFRYAFFLICKHIFLFFLTNEACERQIIGSAEYTGKAAQINMIQEANTLMLVFIPISILSASFERLFACFALIQYAMIFNVGRQRITLLKRISWSQSIQSVLVIGILTITFVEWYFSFGDMVRILNSVEWIFW